MPITPDVAVRQWFAKVWNEGDETAIDAMMASDAIVHGLPSPDGQPLRGPTVFKSFHRLFRDAVSDIRIDVEHLMSEGDMAMAHCRVTGKHTGDSLGFPATNKAVEFEGFTLVRVVDGQIVEGWNSFDFLKMYEQLGVSLNMPR